MSINFNVMRPCTHCKDTDLIITTKKFHGETFYLLHHKDYDSENRKFGLLVYDLFEERK